VVSKLNILRVQIFAILGKKVRYIDFKKFLMFFIMILQLVFINTF